jgi:hypothetical protein
LIYKDLLLEDSVKGVALNGFVIPSKADCSNP